MVEVLEFLRGFQLFLHSLGCAEILLLEVFYFLERARAVQTSDSLSEPLLLFVTSLGTTAKTAHINGVQRIQLRALIESVRLLRPVALQDVVSVVSSLIGQAWQI